MRISPMININTLFLRYYCTIKRNRAFYIIFSALILFHLFLMCYVRIYPFIDLPNHLAKATIYKCHGEPTNHFDDYYRVDIFPKPNVFHLLFTSSKCFPSIEFANKLFTVLYVLLLPLFTLLAINRIGGDPWVSLLSFLCLYNLNVGWGFVDFAFSIPFLLLWFFFLVGYHDKSNISSRIVLAVLFVLLFFMHAITSLFSLLIYFVYNLYRYRSSFGKMTKNLLICAPLLGLLTAWRTTDSGGRGEIFGTLAEYYSSDYVSTIPLRIKHICTFDTAFLMEDFYGNVISSIFPVSIILFFLWSLIRHRKNIINSAKPSPLPGILMFSALLCYFILPPGILCNGGLYERFSVFVLLSMIISAGTLHSKQSKILFRGATCALCVFYSFLWADYFIDFQKENKSFTRDFLSDTADGRLVGLIYENTYRGFPIYIHFPNYNIIWNKAVTATSVIDYEFGSIKRKADYKSLPRYDEWIGRNKTKWWDDYEVFDYLLFRGRICDDEVPPLGNYTLIRHTDQWSLYVKTTR